MTTQFPGSIRPLQNKDFPKVARILSHWLARDEINHYRQAIQENITALPGQAKYNGHYYTAFLEGEVVGVVGFRELLPKLLPFAQTNRPAELNMLYVLPEKCCQGVGRALLARVTAELEQEGYPEVLVRSSVRFKESGWGFYDRMGFQRVGQVVSKPDGQIGQVWRKALKGFNQFRQFENKLS